MRLSAMLAAASTTVGWMSRKDSWAAARPRRRVGADADAGTETSAPDAAAGLEDNLGGTATGDGNDGVNGGDGLARIDPRRGAYTGAVFLVLPSFGSWSYGGERDPAAWDSGTTSGTEGRLAAAAEKGLAVHGDLCRAKAPRANGSLAREDARDEGGSGHGKGNASRLKCVVLRRRDDVGGDAGACNVESMVVGSRFFPVAGPGRGGCRHGAGLEAERPQQDRRGLWWPRGRSRERVLAPGGLKWILLGSPETQSPSLGDGGLGVLEGCRSRPKPLWALWSGVHWLTSSQILGSWSRVPGRRWAEEDNETEPPELDGAPKQN